MLRSWSGFLRISGSTSTKVTGRATQFLTGLLQGTWQWTGYESDLVKTFIKCFFTMPLSIWSSANIYFSGVLTPFLVTAGVIITILVLYQKKHIDRALKYLLNLFWIFIIITYSLLFLLTHCTLFAGEISKYVNAQPLAIAIGRYCAPIYLGGVLAIILCIFTRINEFNIGCIVKNKFFSFGCLLIILLGTNYYAIANTLWVFFPPTESVNKLDLKITEINKEYAWTSYLEPEQEKVYYLTTKAIDRTAIYMKVPIVIQTHDLYYPIYGIGDLQNYLYQQEFKYVYYADESASESLIEICNKMLPEGETMEIGGLYKIDMSKVRFRLRRVNME